MDLGYGLGEAEGAGVYSDPLEGVPFSPVPLCVLFRKLFFNEPSADNVRKLQNGVFSDESLGRMVDSAWRKCKEIEYECKKHANKLNKQQMVLDEAKGLAKAELEMAQYMAKSVAQDEVSQEMRDDIVKKVEAWAKEDYSPELLARARKKVDVKTQGQDTRDETERKRDVVRTLFYCLLARAKDSSFSTEVTGRLPASINYWKEAETVLESLSNAALCLQQRPGEQVSPFCERLLKAQQTMEWVSWYLCPIKTPVTDDMSELEESAESEESRAAEKERKEYKEKRETNVSQALALHARQAIPEKEGWRLALIQGETNNDARKFLAGVAKHYRQKQLQEDGDFRINKLDKPISTDPKGTAVEEWQVQKQSSQSMVRWAKEKKNEQKDEEGEKGTPEELSVHKLTGVLKKGFDDIRNMFSLMSPQQSATLPVNALQQQAPMHIPTPPPTPPPMAAPMPAPVCSLRMVGACTEGASCPFNHVLADAAMAKLRGRSPSPRRHRSRSPRRHRSRSPRRRRSHSPRGERERRGGYHQAQGFYQQSGKGSRGGPKGRKGKGINEECMEFKTKGSCWYMENWGRCKFLHLPQQNQSTNGINETGRDENPP